MPIAPLYPPDVPAIEGLVAELLNRIGCGAALLRADGAVLLTNAHLNAMLGDGLLLREDRLVAAAPRSQGALDSMLAMPDVHAGTAWETNFLALPQPSGLRPLLLRACRLPPDTVLPGQRGEQERVATLLLVFMPEQDLPSPELPLRMMGLTAAEARLAAQVGRGVTPEEASRQLGITVGTARYVLKVVFGKLGVSRQSRLALLTARLAAMSGGE